MSKLSEFQQFDSLSVDDLFAIKGGCGSISDPVCGTAACDVSLCTSSACNSNAYQHCTSTACCSNACSS
ncbi:MAG: hypothetical protein MJZ20_14995, partial [Bacteroidaceae bacterium]|nr:hypothetical protein [Bacteroidaceae bacterium]